MTDAVNHPSHYADGWSNGAEVIDITENLNFNRGNAVKYIARAGKKDPEKELEDLQKAKFYLDREIDRWHNPPTYQVTQDFYCNLEDADGTNWDWDRAEKRKPRVWQSLADVPEDVLVYGADEVPGDYPWYPEDTDEFDHHGPFTEILEDN